MARDDYGAISVISDLEREALGLGGRKPDDEEEGLFETIGKAGDKLGETKLGKKLGSILTVLILAFFGGGGDLSVLGDFLEQEDDGSCEYEEYDCTSNETYFYNGLEFGNYSREPNTLNITVDVDTDCDQDTLPIMLGYDVGHIKIEDNETVWNGYMWVDVFYNVTGWEGDEFELNSGPEFFTEPYTGWYIIWVNLFADWNRDGVYEYVTSFNIEELYLEEEE